VCTESLPISRCAYRGPGVHWTEEVVSFAYRCQCSSAQKLSPIVLASEKLILRHRLQMIGLDAATVTQNSSQKNPITRQAWMGDMIENQLGIRDGSNRLRGIYRPKVFQLS
jgi:hypothetical protein